MVVDRYAVLRQGLGQQVAGTLTAPPPRGPDDQPVPIFGPALESTPL